MKKLLCVAFIFVGLIGVARAGSETASTRMTEDLDAPRFEISTESAYLLGIIGNPNSYEIGAQFVTGRVRWGAVHSDGWLRGFNQVYLLAMAEPIFRGPENHYFGISTGLRYNFVRPGARLIPYISGGVGLGFIDSRPQISGAQGEDFTFNILTAAGVSYKMSEHWKASAGILYQHLSNAQLTDPNPSLNLLGPQLGITYSF
jgi:opacity protein-like surface antigen